MKALRIALIIATCLLDAPSEAARRVTASELGDRWPLTVDEGEIDCIRGPEIAGRWKDAVVFRSDGKTYALNGPAKQRGHLVIDPIWKTDPAKPQLRANMTTLIYLALQECR
jgi:hypothetical protein